MALDWLLQLGDRPHVLEILEVTTALFEFVAGMADHRIFTNQVGISVELNGVAGRQLPCREDLDLDVDNVYKADEVRSNRTELAADVARDIYTHFGWTNPPKDKLDAAQCKKLGQH